MHYAPELGEPFRTAGLCYYRDGRDSVAWHGDTIGRGATADTMVAIVSRRCGPSVAAAATPAAAAVGTVRYELGHGDLIVMGGSCQRTWEHAVPKTARPRGPRISIQFRPRGVRWVRGERGRGRADRVTAGMRPASIRDPERSPARDHSRRVPAAPSVR